MEFNRFMQYAKYDLTINKAFYRNMSIVAVSIITGIAILGFLVRWTMIKNFGVGVDHDGNAFSYYGIGGTVIFITGIDCQSFNDGVRRMLQPSSSQQARTHLHTDSACNEW